MMRMHTAASGVVRWFRDNRGGYCVQQRNRNRESERENQQRRIDQREYRGRKKYEESKWRGGKSEREDALEHECSIVPKRSV
jgi:hypothetical protein